MDVYVDRRESDPDAEAPPIPVFTQIKNQMLHSRAASKVFVTGQKGSGKSMELRRVLEDVSIAEAPSVRDHRHPAARRHRYLLLVSRKKQRGGGGVRVGGDQTTRTTARRHGAAGRARRRDGGVGGGGAEGGGGGMWEGDESGGGGGGGGGPPGGRGGGGGGVVFVVWGCGDWGGVRVDSRRPTRVAVPTRRRAAGGEYDGPFTTQRGAEVSDVEPARGTWRLSVAGGTARATSGSGDGRVERGFPVGSSARRISGSSMGASARARSIRRRAERCVLKPRLATVREAPTDDAHDHAVFEHNLTTRALGEGRSCVTIPEGHSPGRG